MCSSLLHPLCMATTAPRRIDMKLLARAEASGALFHRSGTEQLEHWAALGAAIETVLGLPAVARLKTLGRAHDIDSLIARVGTPAGNRKLASFLRTQAYPQYAAGSATSKDVLEIAAIPSSVSRGRRRRALAGKNAGR